MVREHEIRPGEVQVDVPDRIDAALIYVGRIHTPWPPPAGSSRWPTLPHRGFRTLDRGALGRPLIHAAGNPLLA